MSKFISETDHLSDILSPIDQTLSDQVLTFDAIVHNGVKVILLFYAGVLVLVSIICVVSKLYFILPIPCFMLVVIIIVLMVILTREVKRVIIDSDAVTIKGLCWSQKIKYVHIAKIRHKFANHGEELFSADLLLLLDWNGKYLGRIPMKITNFTVLEIELSQRIQNATDEMVKICQKY
ncbi:MAG: hypothetical protein LBP59_02630 [Planctomycetaceae bacterium]|jgi:hypothetical protein|nr:hypothetical protein [Planctomycetaceae bacterium]